MRGHVLWRWAVLALALVLPPVHARADTDSIRIGKTGEIEIFVATRLGATLLQPGHYQVRHKMIAADHYVVVREQVRPTRRHRALVTGDEIALVPCRVVVLEHPPRLSMASVNKGADGNPTITQIRIAGEPAGHLIVLEPSSRQ